MAAPGSTFDIPRYTWRFSAADVRDKAFWPPHSIKISDGGAYDRVAQPSPQSTLENLSHELASLKRKSQDKAAIVTGSMFMGIVLRIGLAMSVAGSLDSYEGVNSFLFYIFVLASESFDDRVAVMINADFSFRKMLQKKSELGERFNLVNEAISSF